jgi:hypothetical protein
MTKKKEEIVEEEIVEEEESYYDDDTDTDANALLTSMDFNVDDEYKPDPLVPKATYHGVVTKISFNSEQFCIIWDICLHDNDGFMNDQETPIDGSHVWFRNWLPKPGDEKKPTKSGRNNKRQSKINMLKAFSEEFEIDMSTPQKIATSLDEAEWIGIELDADIEIDEYQGRFRNTVNRVRKSTMY